MCSVPVYVGLDYHQKSIQVCVLDAQGKLLTNRSVANDVEGLVRVIQTVGQPVAVALESCCGAADLADKLIQRTGWSVSLSHPGFVRRMKQNPDKTDFSDARLLADLVRAGYLPKVWLAPEETRQLRRLVRFRQQQVDERRNIKLRLRALVRENRFRLPAKLSLWTKAGTAWLQDEAPWSEDDRWIVHRHLQRLEELKKSIGQTEQRIRERTKDDKIMQKLLEQPSVGLVTAATLRAEVGRFDRFRNAKQLARFCSISPRNASSGERQADAGLIRAGNPQLRVVLVELAHRLVHRCDPRWGKLAHDLLDRGKQKNVVIAAIANRWVRNLYHAMKDLGA